MASIEPPASHGPAQLAIAPSGEGNSSGSSVGHKCLRSQRSVVSGKCARINACTDIVGNIGFTGREGHKFYLLGEGLTLLSRTHIVAY